MSIRSKKVENAGETALAGGHRETSLLVLDMLAPLGDIIG
jgi:hypothetical protein